MKSPSNKISPSPSNLHFKSRKQYSQLVLEIKKINVDLQHQITALKKENFKFQKKAAQLSAKNVSLLNEIGILRKEYSKYQHDNPPREKLTAEQTKDLKLMSRLFTDHKIALLRKEDEKLGKNT